MRHLYAKDYQVSHNNPMGIFGADTTSYIYNPDSLTWAINRYILFQNKEGSWRAGNVRSKQPARWINAKYVKKNHLANKKKF